MINERQKYKTFPPAMWQPEEDLTDPPAGYVFTPDSTPELEVFFFHTDHLGSTSYLTDSAGSVCQFVCYTPYGEAFVDEHTTSYENPFKFSGKELDDVTGLYDHWMRLRNPITTLWLTPDPLRDFYPEFSPYNYCYSNPVKFIDRFGMEGEETDQGILLPEVVVEAKRNQNTYQYYNPQNYLNGMQYMWQAQTAQRTHETNVSAHNMAHNAGNQSNSQGAGQPFSKQVHQNNNHAFGKPSMSALGLSFNLIVGGGFGVDLKVGELENGKLFISLTPKVGVGFDIGFSAEIETAYYHGSDEEFETSLAGMSTSMGGALGLGMEYNQTLEDKGRNPKWTGVSYTGGVDAGLSATLNYTFVLFKW